MSSGGIAVAPLAIPVIVAAGAVVVVGGAAVLLVRAAGAATEFVAAGVERLGEAVERAARADEDIERSARLWEMAAAEVVGLNARIAVLSAAAARSGATIAVPAPLDPACLTLSQIRDWCVAVPDRLRDVRARLDAVTAQAETAALGPARGTSAGEVLARHQEQLRQRYAAVAVPPPVPTDDDRAAIAADVARLLRKLDPDALPDERAHVLAAAANVAQQTDVGTAESYLLELRHRVDQVVNPKVARRALAATWLGALEQSVVAAEPNPPFPHVVDRLRRVVAGDDDLTPELRSDAQAAVRWAGTVVDRVFLQDTVQSCLADLGYAVDPAFDVTHGGLRLVRRDWGAHAADVWFTDGEVRGCVVRTVDAEGAEAAAVDRERCDDFNDDLERLAVALRDAGVVATPRTEADERVQRAEASGTWRTREAPGRTHPIARVRKGPSQ